MTAALQTVQPETADIEGRIDAIANGRIYGWAWDRNRPADRVVIEIRVDDHPIARIDADTLREDLRANGIGDGKHAFEIAVEIPPQGVLTALACSPSSGATVPLRARTETETATEALLAQPIKRLNMLIEAVHLTQQQIQAGNQVILRTLRDQPKPDGAAAEKAKAVLENLEALAADHRSLGQQVEGIEVFLMRIDTTLREMDGNLKRLSTGNADRPLRVAVGLLGLLTAVTLAATVMLHTTI